MAEVKTEVMAEVETEVMAEVETEVMAEVKTEAMAKVKTEAKTEVDIQEYTPTIKKILSDSDNLDAITAKDVRIKLEQLYKVDLTSRKQEVQKLIEQCFDEFVKVEDTSQEHSTNSVKKASIKSPTKKPAKPKGRPPKAKQAQSNGSESSSLEDDYGKKHKKKPKNARKGVDVSDITDKEINGKKSKSKNGDTSKKKKSGKRKKADGEEGGERPPKKKRGNTGIHKPLLLSPVLAKFLGEVELSRLEVVKRLWTYIKEHELQDPKDKRYIICDEKFTQIFGHNRIHSFTMNKYLKDHLYKKEDVVDGEGSQNFGDVDRGNSSAGGGDEEHDDEDVKMEDLFGPEDSENGWLADDSAKQEEVDDISQRNESTDE